MVNLIRQSFHGSCYAFGNHPCMEQRKQTNQLRNHMATRQRRYEHRLPCLPNHPSEIVRHRTTSYLVLRMVTQRTSVPFPKNLICEPYQRSWKQLGKDEQRGHQFHCCALRSQEKQRIGKRKPW